MNSYAMLMAAALAMGDGGARDGAMNGRICREPIELSVPMGVKRGELEAKANLVELYTVKPPDRLHMDQDHFVAVVYTDNLRLSGKNEFVVVWFGRDGRATSCEPIRTAFPKSQRFWRDTVSRQVRTAETVSQ
jgi:hypothetical protein